MTRKGSVLGGSLLIAGTSIGGGILALPVLTSVAGFFPSLLAFLVCWAFMAGTGLLFLELCMWMKHDTNIVSMAEYTLGKVGKGFAFLLYIFLFYCLTIAYLDGVGDLFVVFLGNQISETQGVLLCLLVFTPFLYAGVRIVGRLNYLLMGGLGFFYFLFLFVGIPHIQPSMWFRAHWPAIFFTLPIAFVSFAYQGIVPTLARYLEYDAPRIRKSILVGSFLPLIVYFLWQALIMGIVPLEGPGGLLETWQLGKNAVYPLRQAIPGQHIFAIGQSFAFFALVTSFFGVTLGLFDFLADGFHIKKTPKGKVFLCLLILVPSAVIALYHPRLFLQAFDLAGGFGCALLLGLYPILMVWSGRYRMNLPQVQTALPGGKILLALMAAFVIFEVVCEIVNLALQA